MPVYSGYVQASGKDWDESGAASNATTLTFVRTTDAGGAPTVEQVAYAILNTSAVTTGGTITAATFYWKHNTNDASKQMRLAIWNGVGYSELYAGFGGGANVVKSTGTTDATLLGYINSSGGTETKLAFNVNHSTPNLSRTCKIYSFDSGSTVAPYVVISYNDPVVPSSFRRRPFIIT